MRKQFSRRALSEGIVPIHGENVSGRLHYFRPSIELKEKNVSEMLKFLHLVLHFLTSTLHSLSSNDKTWMCKIKNNN